MSHRQSRMLSTRTFFRPTTANSPHEVPHDVAQLVLHPHFPRHRRTVPPPQRTPQCQGTSQTSDARQPGLGDARAAVDDGRYSAIDLDRRRDDHRRGRRHEKCRVHPAALARGKHPGEPAIRDGQRHRYGRHRLPGEVRDRLVRRRNDHQAGSDRDQGRPHLRAERDFLDQPLGAAAGNHCRSDRHRHDRQQRSCAGVHDRTSHDRTSHDRTSHGSNAVASRHACRARCHGCTDAYRGRDAIHGSCAFGHERLGQWLQRRRDGSQHDQHRVCQLDGRFRLRRTDLVALEWRDRQPLGQPLHRPQRELEWGDRGRKFDDLRLQCHPRR